MFTMRGKRYYSSFRLGFLRLQKRSRTGFFPVYILSLHMDNPEKTTCSDWKTIIQGGEIKKAPRFFAGLLEGQAACAAVLYLNQRMKVAIITRTAMALEAKTTQSLMPIE